MAFAELGTERAGRYRGEEHSGQTEQPVQSPPGRNVPVGLRNTEAAHVAGTEGESGGR